MENMRRILADVKEEERRARVKCEEETQRKGLVVKAEVKASGERIKSLMGQVREANEERDKMEAEVEDLRTALENISDAKGHTGHHASEKGKEKEEESSEGFNDVGFVERRGRKPLVYANVPCTRVHSPSRNALGTIVEEREEYDMCNDGCP